jgi:3-oxoacyl-[acyl-carrier-protein] synthase-1
MVGVVNTAAVTSVGFSAPAACAAIRAGISNPSPTKFMDSAGEPILGHAVPLPFEEAWAGRPRLVAMGIRAIRECLAAVPAILWPEIPVLLCVAERDRPGRLAHVDDELLRDLANSLDCSFHPASRTFPRGTTGAYAALRVGRGLLAESSARFVLIVGVDTFLNSGTLSAYRADHRILTSENSNGFMPGEGAAAVLIAADEPSSSVAVTGLGFAVETAHVSSDQPLRADGLTRAVADALQEAGVTSDSVDFRITDIAGEYYYFKEAALAVSRCLRRSKAEFDLWHPAECTGQIGAAMGPLTVAVAAAAVKKGYAKGPRILCHCATDNGQRAVAIVESTGGHHE